MFSKSGKVRKLLVLDSNFPRPDLGLIIGPFPVKKMSINFPKMEYIIPNFLALHFAKNFMNIRTKIPKLQIHENLHENVNENMFSFTFYDFFFMCFYGGQLNLSDCIRFSQF